MIESHTWKSLHCLNFCRDFNLIECFHIANVECEYCLLFVVFFFLEIFSGVRVRNNENVVNFLELCKYQ